MISYEELKASLDANISLMEQKVAVIDNLRINREKLPNTEQMKLLDSGSTQHSSIIALMLQAKSNARAEHGINYQPVIIKDHESLDKLKDIVKQKYDSKQPLHYDLIIQMPDPERGDAHCTPLQIHSNGDNMEIFHIDAAGVITNLPFILQVANTVKIDSKLYYNNAIQKDIFSCSTFSIQDLNSMTNLGAKNLNQSLNSMESIRAKEHGTCDILKLSPRFVKNAQSGKAIRENLANEANRTVIVSKNKTLEQHVEDYSITVEVAEQATGAITRKKQNRAIDYKTLKYLKAARDELDEIYKKGGEQMVRKVIAERMGGIIFDPKPAQELTKADKYKIMQSTKDILTNNKDIISFNNEMDKFIDQLTVDKIGKQATDQDKQQIRERVEAKLEKIIAKSPEKDIYTQALQLMKQKDTVKDIGNIICRQQHNNGNNKDASLPRVQQAKHKTEYRHSI
ncbi:hypothetical protein [Candidatus Tisiphia endosymbiont of Oplodontha viridula]|uniref:hypothetical protein n=1 Tax=Candidatus Tisiphia endosymbiont of Oplodontha viridula TaxID=3077925 RepID=UPI0035C89347